MDVYTLKFDKKHAVPREGAIIARSDDDRTAVRFDYTLGRFTRFCARARLDEQDTTAAVLLSVPGLSFSVKLEHKWLRKLGTRELGASLDWSEGDVWLHWAPGEGAQDLGSLVLGEQRQERVVRATFATELLLPEGRYPCVVTLLDIVTYRERAPELTRRTFAAAEVSFAIAPPFPGKGESPHDIDDDYIARSYMPEVSTVADALAQIYARVMRLREKRGGFGWEPKSAPQPLDSFTPIALPPEDGPDLEAVGRWLPGADVWAYAKGETGLVVVRLHRDVDESVLHKAANRLFSIAASIPGAKDLHVALVHRGRVTELCKNTVIPFNPEIWPGSVAVFC